MKTLMLIAMGASGLCWSGCRTVAVVAAPVPAVHATVYYSHGRPYYYRNRVRYWGYPAGYVAPHRVVRRAYY